jgi:hypothetical protein
LPKIHLHEMDAVQHESEDESVDTVAAAAKTRESLSLVVTGRRLFIGLNR